jgi:UMF1 family MFS transporter
MSRPAASAANPSPAFPGRPGEIFAWAMYDWASSAYSTLSITVVAFYIASLTAEAKWGAVALLSPIVGAMADANRSKRKWLAATALAGAAAAVLTAAVPPSQPWLVVVLFALMHMLFEISYVPYNGFLPEITDERTINRVSAWGYALGYAGGGLALAIALLVVLFNQQLGVPDGSDQARLGLLLLGLWWGLFSLPTLWILRDRGPAPEKRDMLGTAAREALGEVVRTLRSIRSYHLLALFLLAYLLYNEGVQTIIMQASNFAKLDLGFSPDDYGELAALILMIQFVALPGAMLVGWLSDRCGQKPTLIGCLVVLVGICTAAWLVQSKLHFWIMGAVFALVMGGTQSVSRAIMGRMTPPERSAEFFGFFGFSGKATSFLGSGLFALVVAWTGSGRPAIFALLGFFLVGGLIVACVNVEEGRRQALKA